MSRMSDFIRRNPLLGWSLFLITAIGVAVVAFLASSILERRLETRQKQQVMNPVGEDETRNQEWGKNFPREYERYIQTKNSDFASLEGGSVEIDMLERDPRLVVLWAGYAFSRDYKQGRGHYNAITDIRNTLRTDVPQKATCWTCKSPDVVRLMRKSGGPKEFYKKPWEDVGHEMVNPIGCLDCHDPKTMALRITRPALVEAFERQGKNIAEATHQQMRSLVCAQCHVEYYFKGEGKYLTFPWDKGITSQEVEEYYVQNGHVDFKHAISKAPILKAQHPDYELFTQGIHAQSGIACADCHMPYRSEGGVKVTDHKIQSPLNNIANSCQVCHRESEETLRNNVYERQEKVREVRIKAEDALVHLHYEAKAAWDAGATEEEMKPILTKITSAQWSWDYVAASHGASFHASLEAARIYGNSIDISQQARIELARILSKYHVTQPVVIPDLSTKAKAQQAIGLPMDELRQAKKEFLEKIVTQWDEGKPAHRPKP